MVQLFLRKHFGVVALIAAAISVLPSGPQERMVRKQTVQRVEPTSIDFTATGPIADPLLVESAFSPDGRELSRGGWEFPGQTWNLSTRETHDLPEAPAHVFSTVEIEVLTANQPSEASVDDDMLVLIRSLMAPIEESDDYVSYRHETASTRGLAVCRMVNGVETPIWVSLQWPATNNRWTEVTLQRGRSLDASQTLMPLPAGANVVSLRRDPSGQIQCQVVAIPRTPEHLGEYLQDHGWTIRREDIAPHCFWAQSASGVFEFSWNVKEEHKTVYLIRPLSTGIRNALFKD